MKETTRTHIYASLAHGPRTQNQIVGACKLSKATVVHALQQLNLDVIPGTWPRQYMLPESMRESELVTPTGMPDHRADPAEPGQIIALYDRDDWVKVYPGGKLDFQNKVVFRIDPRAKKAEREEHIKNLRYVASVTASYAYALEQTLSAPDWFTLLGGDIKG